MPRLTRRRFVQGTTGAAAAAAAATATGAGASLGAPGCDAPIDAPVFFTDAAHRALGALADFVLPADARDPGAGGLGAADYIEALLTAFEWPDGPRLWLGGPFSGRAPYPTEDGRPSDAHPPNDFANAVPLDRVTEAAWRLRLYGSDGVPTGGPNDALLGPVRGLRDLVAAGVADAMARAPAPLETLDRDALQDVWNDLDPDFRDSLVELVLESLLAPPEYGGNRDGGGWRIAHWEGDTQPLGFSVFDHVAGTYRERPEAPVSTPDTAPDADPLDDVSRTWVDLVTVSLGGRLLE